MEVESNSANSMGAICRADLEVQIGSYSVHTNAICTTLCHAVSYGLSPCLIYVVQESHVSGILQ